VTREEPYVRPTARAVVIDPQGRVLLFRVAVPRAPERFFWITPGGGVQGAESYEEAIRREIWEETGVDEFKLGPCVWERTATSQFSTRWIQFVERYFVAWVPHAEVIAENREAAELTFLQEHRWFSLEELRTHPERVVPGQLAALVEPILRGELPIEPLAVE
jgi:8-oxo-dGTP pyrophosphatase MutT (NUDIX family)